MSELKPCKTCAELVSVSAKTCPQCGDTNPVVPELSNKEARNGCFVVIGLIVIAVLAMTVFEKFSGNAQKELITQAQYGKDWPYIIDSGKLFCDAPGSNVVMEQNGIIYALNGRAMGNVEKRGYVSGRAITKKDEWGSYVSTTDIIQRGLEMCKAK